ncbi:peptidase M28, partial [Colwellia ponticola]
MKPTSIFCLFLLLFISHTNYAQTTVDDPEIKKMVAEVKSENMEATVRKLVSFGTRHTLSDTKSNTRG